MVVASDLMHQTTCVLSWGLEVNQTMFFHLNGVNNTITTPTSAGVCVLSLAISHLTKPKNSQPPGFFVVQLAAFFLVGRDASSQQSIVNRSGH